MKAIERFQTAIEPYLDDFEQVLRVIELSSGFVLLPVAVPGPDLARMLAHWLSANSRSMRIVEPESADDWKNLASLLLTVCPEKNGAVVVIASGDLPEDLSLPLRLVNERRDAIAKHLDCPLLWCGSSAFLVQTGRQAPDFWSVRAVERRIEPQNVAESKKKAACEGADLLSDALQQNDRKSSEILSLSRLRKAMEHGHEDDFDEIAERIPKSFVETDRTFAFELGLMKAEMDRRRGNIGDALKTLDALKCEGNVDEESRALLLRGRIWEGARDLKNAERAYRRAHELAATQSLSGKIAGLYLAALHDDFIDLTDERKIAHEIKHVPLEALAAAFLAKALANQYDLHGATRQLEQAIALHEKSKEEPTILFGGEVAEAIHNAKSAIERSPAHERVAHVLPTKTRPQIFWPALIGLAILFVAVITVLVYDVRRSDPKYCFHHSDGKIICANSLAHCEKLRSASGGASAGPCQQPIFESPR